jgi:GGDEF domain-containing protein
MKSPPPVPIMEGNGIDSSLQCRHGTAALVDLGHVRAITDRQGYPVGDAAIQAAAEAIRALVRAEDLLFRWTENTLLVLAPGLDALRANERFLALEPGVPFALRSGTPEIMLQLTWRVAEFGGSISIQEAIARAEAARTERLATQRAVLVASRDERLKEFFRRLAERLPAASRDDAFNLLTATLNEVEDELTRIVYNPESWAMDGRLYPPLPDSRRSVEGWQDITRWRSKGHNTFIRDNGAIEIVRIPDGTVVFQAVGQDGRGVWE